uniref:DNA helicase n=1 Tax=Elaeophora elaphi TaxID=1147741 RepID=A0A0R3RQR2_9BILA
MKLNERRFVYTSWISAEAQANIWFQKYGRDSLDLRTYEFSFGGRIEYTEEFVLCRSGGGCKENSMGLGTVIDISATPMRSIKNDCDDEAADMSNDQITTTLHPSSLLLDRSVSSPEMKDSLSSEHSNLRHIMQQSEAQEDVPSDPFVFSTHQLKGNEVCSTNGTNIVLAAEQPLEDRCFDSNSCPHDPEPSTSKEGVTSKEIDNEPKDQASNVINGKYNLKTSIDIGNSSQIAANDPKESDKDVTTQLSISVPSGNRKQHVGSTDLGRQISSSVPKQELFPAVDVRQGVPRRSLINTAPLSPNHYGSILAQTSLPFRINRHSQLSGSHKTSVLTNANEISMRSEREISADVKEPQQKKQKIQEERIMTAHLTPSSSSPMVNAGEDHLQIPSEQILNKALDLLRKPAQDDINEPKPAPKRSYSKKINSSTVMDYKDGLYRKILQEKIGKLRDKNGLALSVPHLERAHLSQLVNLLLRFKNHFALSDFLSKEVSDHVFGDGSAIVTEKLVQDVRNPISGEMDRSLMKYVMDADATESEDSDEENEGQMPSTSNAYLPFGKLSSHAYFNERVRLGTLDAKALCIEEDCEEKISVVYRQLDSIRRQKKKVCSWNDEALSECCARCLPFDGKRRRILKRRKVDRIGKNGLCEHETPILLDTEERVRAYATVDNRVYSPLPLLAAVPVERGAEVYCRRRSTRPIIHLRKRPDRSPWTTFLEERKLIVKEAVIVDDRQTRRKRERSESEESYDDDEEYQPHTNSQRGSHSKRPSTLKRAGQNLAGRSFDRKRNGDFRNRRFTNHRLRLLRTNDIEDGLVEPMPGLPQKIDYKEICIPHWERKPLKLVPEESTGCMHLAECSCVANISRRHLPYELNERKRFQQYRDYVAAKSAATASKLSGSSHSKLPAASTAPSATGSAESLSLLESVQSVSAAPSPATLYCAFDDDQLSSNNGESAPDHDRPSVASPYSPRIFPVPVVCFL